MEQHNLIVTSSVRFKGEIRGFSLLVEHLNTALSNILLFSLLNYLYTYTLDHLLQVSGLLTEELKRKLVIFTSMSELLKSKLNQEPVLIPFCPTNSFHIL